jgi:predicted nucleotidyltransferase
MHTAQALLSPDFSEKLRIELDKGLSFPAARAAALGDDSLLRNPNDILAVEYCKAILAQKSSLDIFPIRRDGSYHADTPDAENPSATSLRSRIAEGTDWLSYIPASAHPAFENAATHTLTAGERAILARLRTMTDADFEALPYGSEGLWRKLMHACRDSATLEEIIAKTKSKRYTRTRIDRMILCAFLGITSDRMASPAPYTRVLGFTDAGRVLLKKARETGLFPHTGDAVDDVYQALEARCDDLYGLFAHEPETAGITAKRRVYIKKAPVE